MSGAWAVIWQSAVGTLVTAVLGVLGTWLAHRKGWLAKPAAAVAGWLRAEGGTISADTVKLIADELQKRGLAVPVAKPEALPSGEPPPVKVEADPGLLSPQDPG